ncbi:NADH:flavin oxidoreductase [Anaeroselena agilis]|uniref:NADH:flavin oxidoreductase n=1 Tax=Anaeroselena agilis TaxID=3063788 RepID=A0ABU3NWW7_9FIRM|nr:NADH:flavin oxidoreductase [Selenomonadales bacterium 4137-cl]
MAVSVVFDPVTVGPLKLKNRFVRSATQDFMAEPDGAVSGREVELYRALAAGEVGMIITGHSYVQQPLGRASVRQNAIFDDRFVAGYRRAAEAAHAHGAALVLQVSHAGRQTPPDWPEGQAPVAPSAVTDGSTGMTPRELTEEEIWSLVDAYAAAVGRAKASGCDGAQLHVAHGYLLSSFISPYTNGRTDKWGGSLENRVRILGEIMQRARRAAGDAYPILAKLNSTDGMPGEGYLTLDDVVATAKALEAWGVAAIEVSGGIREAKGVMSAPGIARPEQEAYFAAAAKAVKAAVKVPVILVGGLRSLAVMERVVADGSADLVALSRPLVKEPDLVARMRRGQAKASCVSCNACFNTAGLKCWLPEK